MHNAPAVAFPTGRSAFQGGLLGVLLGCEVLTLVAWSLAADLLFGWPQVVALVGICVTGIWAVWSWWHTPAGHLTWDGVVWHVSFTDSSWRVQPVPVIDLQRSMLLYLNSTETTPANWVWLDRSFSPGRWMALRRAIHDQRNHHNTAQSSLITSPERISK